MFPLGNVVFPLGNHLYRLFGTADEILWKKSIHFSKFVTEASSFIAAFIIFAVWKFSCARCAKIFWHSYYSFCMVSACL